MISPILGNIIAGGLVLMLVYVCVRFLIREAKSGGCAGCSGHCTSCGSAGGCSHCQEPPKPDEAFLAWRAKQHADKAP